MYGTGYGGGGAEDNGIFFDNYEMAHFRLITDVKLFTLWKKLFRTRKKII